MQTRTLTATLLAFLAGSLLTAGTAHAQFGGGMPTGPGGPFGGGMPNAPDSGGGSPFSSARMPFALGTISAVNAGAGTITVRSQFGGELRTVKITATTDISARVDAKVSDLKVGDTVQVRGVPTGITASQISAGDTAPGPMMDNGMMGGDPMGGGTFGMGRPNGVAGPSGPEAAYAQASGKITALSPLTIALPGGVSVMLTAAPDAKISRTVSEKIGSLKVGDTVMASGQPAADGSLAATRLRVNDNPAAGFGG